MEGTIGTLARVVMWVGLAAFACSAQASGADKPPSFEEVKAAAKAGSAEAENDLGNRYLQGAGVAKDEVQAAIWYRKAAEQGYAPAQSALGGLYLHGVGVPPDAMQASDWIRKAAEQCRLLGGSRHSLQEACLGASAIPPHQLTSCPRYVRHVALQW
ncbi:sel1 repeat family protein [Stenotrophomonas sp. SRS1]|nr:sel1 repeat family protein [Stenotrophomonas sp. SRS1]